MKCDGIRAGLRRAYRRLWSGVFEAATVISPVCNTKLRYRYVYKKRLRLKNPEGFTEKLLWLKLYRYNQDPLVIQCADKYLVRDYVRQCGLEHILTPLLGVWERPEDIPRETLPEKFVLKWNFGAGMNVICKDKSQLDWEKTVKQLKIWRKSKCWLSHSEMQYKYIPKRLLCEEFLQWDEQADIPDYKVYCFHGEPKAIFVMHDRCSGKVKTEFFDVHWNALENSGKYIAPEMRTPKPECLEELLKAAATLSSPFPFVRCDFYVLGNQIRFGELTFTPAGGMYTSQTRIDGKDMGEFLRVPFS